MKRPSTWLLIATTALSACGSGDAAVDLPNIDARRDEATGSRPEANGRREETGRSSSEPSRVFSEAGAEGRLSLVEAFCLAAARCLVEVVFEDCAQSFGPAYEDCARCLPGFEECVRQDCDTFVGCAVPFVRDCPFRPGVEYVCD